MHSLILVHLIEENIRLLWKTINPSKCLACAFFSLLVYFIFLKFVFDPIPRIFGLRKLGTSVIFIFLSESVLLKISSYCLQYNLIFANDLIFSSLWDHWGHLDLFGLTETTGVHSLRIFSFLLLWAWKLGQGHLKLISYLLCPNCISIKFGKNPTTG